MADTTNTLRETLSTRTVLKALRLYTVETAEAKGFAPHRAQYVIRRNGRSFPAKAIVGLAASRLASTFSGGVAHLGRLLARLGFALVKITVVVLVACSARKADSARVAKDLYTGDFFRKGARYGAAQGATTMILSALHGLVGLNEVIAPYNHRLTRGESAAWGARVLGQLAEQFDLDTTHFVFLTGKDYAAPLLGALDASTPLEGLGLGHKRSWLKARGA